MKNAGQLHLNYIADPDDTAPALRKEIHPEDHAPFGVTPIFGKRP